MNKVHFAIANPDLDPQWTHLRHIESLFEQSKSEDFMIVSCPSIADRIVFIDCHQMNNRIIETIHSSPIFRKHSEKCLVYDERDRPDFAVRGLYVNTLLLFDNVRQIVPCEYMRVSTDFLEPALETEKSILATFRGSRTHWTRTSLLDWNHTALDIMDTSNSTNQFSDINNIDIYRSYLDAFRRSKFSMCPRGHGVASFRFYESLAMRTIPVICSDLWRLPPLLSSGNDYYSLAERKLVNETHCVELLSKLDSLDLKSSQFLSTQKFDRLCRQVMSVDMNSEFRTDERISTMLRLYRSVHEKCAYYGFLINRSIK